VEDSLVVDNLDVYDRVGAFTAYVISILTPISDGNATIRFDEVTQNSFISAIEVLEVYSNSTPVPTISPTPIPIAAPEQVPTQVIPSSSSGVVRVNAGGPRYNDTMGNTWVGDKYVKGNGAVSAENCPVNVTNTLDDALYCTQRFFRPTDPSPFVYEVPVNETSQYEVRLYFSENVSQSTFRNILFVSFLFY
jgi:Malectin domain